MLLFINIKCDFMRKLLILMGLPGSGKGTCAYYINKNFSYSIVSVGNILRNEVEKMTTEGLIIKEKIDKGELVDDDIIKLLISREISKLTNSARVLFDGFPRNISQARLFLEMRSCDDFLSGTQIEVLYLSVRKDLVIERLHDRIICKYCGLPYSKKVVINTSDSCISCGNVNFISMRTDDSLDSLILNRIKIAEVNNKNLIDFYKDNKIHIYEIDGSCDIDLVNRKIDNLLL